MVELGGKNRYEGVDPEFQQKFNERYNRMHYILNQQSGTRPDILTKRQKIFGYPMVLGLYVAAISGATWLLSKAIGLDPVSNIAEKSFFVGGGGAIALIYANEFAPHIASIPHALGKFAKSLDEGDYYNPSIQALLQLKRNC